MLPWTMREKRHDGAPAGGSKPAVAEHVFRSGWASRHAGGGGHRWGCMNFNDWDALLWEPGVQFAPIALLLGPNAAGKHEKALG